MSEQRAPQLPSVPTVAEAGFSGLIFVLWYALWGPKGMPPDLVTQINAAVQAASKHPELVQKLTAPRGCAGDRAATGLASFLGRGGPQRENRELSGIVPSANWKSSMNANPGRSPIRRQPHPLRPRRRRCLRPCQRAPREIAPPLPAGRNMAPGGVTTGAILLRPTARRSIPTGRAPISNGSFTARSTLRGRRDGVVHPPLDRAAFDLVQHRLRAVLHMAELIGPEDSLLVDRDTGGADPPAQPPPELGRALVTSLGAADIVVMRDMDRP